jgi:predicted RNase H-like HicB family nuclease
MQAMTHYIGVVHKDPDSDYGVSFPDFPGCITAGSTVDEAKDMAHEALYGHMETMMADGYEIPEPSSLEKIMADLDYVDAVAFLVIAVQDSNPKTVRVNITVPENTLRRIDSFAKKRGMSRSSFLIHAAQSVIFSDSFNSPHV